MRRWGRRGVCACVRGRGITSAALAPTALIVALFALVLPPTASAHQEPFSYLDVRVGPSGLAGQLTAHVEDLAHETGIPSRDSLFDAAFVAGHLPQIHAMLEARLHLAADGHAIRPAWGGFSIVRERKAVSFEWSWSGAPPRELRIEGPLFPYDPPHETYLNVYEGSALRLQDLLDRSKTEARYYSGSRQGVWAVVLTFVVQGIHHIFIGPDHILFVVGLLLLGGGVARLFKIVTAFTIAHSITLALATLGLVTPPARIVEPAIALSIVYVGVETLLARKHSRDWRAPIAFGFGFVHGFGFASVLREFGLPNSALGWSLAAFNVGVELGQACIVLAVAPLLAWIQARRPALGGRVVTIGAACVIVAGGFWFFQRVLQGA